MLELLVKYSSDHNLVAEPGFKPKDVRWGLVCDGQGRFLEVLELGNAGQPRNRGQTFPMCPDLSQPEIKRGGEGCRHFLVDQLDVTTLFGSDKLDKKARAKLLAKHAYFINLLRQAFHVTPALGFVIAVLENSATLEEINTSLVEQRARPTDKITFAIEGYDPPYVVDSAAWHNWWRQFRRSLTKRRDHRSPWDETRKTASMRCLASGALVEAVPTQPMIRGLADVGGLASGDALASYKQESFSSYGLSQAANAAVSAEMAASYRAALEHLLRERGQRLAKAKVVHWFKTRVSREDDPLPWLISDDEAAERGAQRRAKQLLGAIQSGQRPDLRDNYYYALTLSGASGRVMVRDWMEGQFETLVASVDAWFDDLAVVRRDGIGLAPPPKFMAVLGALVRDLDEIAQPVVTKMWRVAVCREAVPHHVLARALHRATADILNDEPPRHAGMGLIRAYHVRKGVNAMTAYLNEEHPAPAYHCGRLMALLASLQYAALGDVGAGVVQRYYAAASSTPALVLGRLTRTSQFHLNKLDTGLARWFENKIGGVWSRIRDDVPGTLSLEDQSLFALGYYHQMAADRPKPKADTAHAEPRQAPVSKGERND
jgi:CRISPR-associated protein Csd1